MSTKKRLIDANALSDEVDKSKHNNPHPQGMIRVNHRNEHDHFLRMVNDATTVDAVEVPPVKIGDTAYFIIHRKIYKAEVYFIRWEHHKQYGIHSEISASVGQYSVVGASFGDFGKTLFLTEDEAKAALAKMDGGNENERS